MLVKDCMTRHPIMIQADMLASQAQQLMAENGIRHLPVNGPGKRLEGLITRNSFALNPDVLGSLNVWEISRRLANVRVKQVMVKGNKVITTTPDTTVERAAHVLKENRIGCLPVIEDNVIVGIITEADIMNALEEMLGLPAEGVRVTMRMPNRPGEFAKLITHLAEQGWGVMGIGTYPTRRQEGMYDVVLKIPRITREDAENVLSKIPDQEVVDVRTQT